MEGVRHGPYDPPYNENSASKIPVECSTSQTPFPEEMRPDARKGGIGSAILIALPDDRLPLLNPRYDRFGEDGSWTNPWCIRKTTASEWSWETKGRVPATCLSAGRDAARDGPHTSFGGASPFAEAHTPDGRGAMHGPVQNGSALGSAARSYQADPMQTGMEGEYDSPLMGLLLTTSFVLPNADVARSSTATFMEHPVAGTAVLLKRSPHSFTVALRPDQKFVTSVLPPESKETFPVAPFNFPSTVVRGPTAFSPLGSGETSPKGHHSATFGKFSPLFVDEKDEREEEEEEEAEEIGYTLTFVNINPISSASPPPGGIPSSSSTPYRPREKEESKHVSSSVPPHTSTCSPSHLASSATVPSFPSSIAPLSLDVDGLHLIQPLPLPLLVSQLPLVRKGDVHLIVTHVDGHRRAYVPLRVSDVYDDHCAYEMDALVSDFSSGGAAFDQEGNFVGLQHQSGKVCIALFIREIVHQLFQSDLLGCCRSPISDVPVVERRDSLSLAETTKSAPLLQECVPMVSPSRLMNPKEKAMHLAGFEGTSFASRMTGGGTVSEAVSPHRGRSGPPIASRRDKNSTENVSHSTPILSALHLSQGSDPLSAVRTEANRNSRTMTSIVSRTPGFEEVYREFFTPFFCSYDTSSSVQPFASSPVMSMMESDGKQTLATSSCAVDTLTASFQSLIHMLFGFCYSAPLMQLVLREIQEKKYTSLHSQVGRSGGIGMMLALLDENQQNQAFVESCLSCLAVLCLDVGNLAIFTQLNGVVSVMAVLPVYPHYSPILQWGLYCLMHATKVEGTSQSREAVHTFLQWNGFGVVTNVLVRYGAKNGCLAGWVGCLLDHLLDVEESLGVLTWMLQDGVGTTAVSFFIQHVTDRFVLCGFLPFLRHVIRMIQEAHDTYRRRQEEDGHEGASSTTHEKEGQPNLSPYFSSEPRTTFPLFLPLTAVPMQNHFETTKVEHDQENTPTRAMHPLKTVSAVGTMQMEAVNTRRDVSSPDGAESSTAGFLLPYGVEEHPHTVGSAQAGQHTLPENRTADNTERRNNATNRVLCHPFCGIPCIFADFLSLLAVNDSFINALQYVCLSESEGRLPRSAELLRCVADILNAFIYFKMVPPFSFVSALEKALYRIKKHLPAVLELTECYQALLNLHSQFAEGVKITPV